MIVFDSCLRCRLPATGAGSAGGLGRSPRSAPVQLARTSPGRPVPAGSRFWLRCGGDRAVARSRLSAADPIQIAPPPDVGKADQQHREEDADIDDRQSRPACWPSRRSRSATWARPPPARPARGTGRPRSGVSTRLGRRARRVGVRAGILAGRRPPRRGSSRWTALP